MDKVTNDRIDLREGVPLSDTGLGLNQRLRIDPAKEIKVAGRASHKPVVGYKSLSLVVVDDDKPRIDLGDTAEKFSEAGMSFPGGYAAKVKPQNDATTKQLIADL